MMPTAKSVTLKAFAGLAQLVAALGLMIFVPAGTVRYPEGWAFLGLFAGSSLAITLYLMQKDPDLLARRTQAGPVAEKERSQRIIQAFASVSFIATVVLPSLDHRLHGSRVPLAGVIGGDTLVALGFGIVFLVFRENTFTSAVVEVAAGQRVIDTGPYAVVRHPMYAGALLLLAGIPLALGSVFGLVAFPPFVGVLVWRLLDEERFLARNLPGYAAYREHTRRRLVPGVW